MRATYRAKTLARWQTSGFYDVGRPLRIELETADAGIGTITDESVSVQLPLAELFERLPEFLRSPDGAEHKRPAASAPRTVDYVYEDAHAHELTYQIAAPHGFLPDPLPPSETITLGPARYTTGYRVEPDGTVSATFRFDSGKARFSPAELTAFLTAMKTLGDRRLPSVTFHQVGEAALAAGRVREALAEFRRLDTQHPRDELRTPVEIARAYLEDHGLGAGGARAGAAAPSPSTPSRRARSGRSAGCWSTIWWAGGSKPGADPKGAEAAYRKAMELDGDDQVAARVAGDPARARRRRR